jgi:prevent-host-death family protein
MNVATSGRRVEVGVRELKNHLSQYLGDVVQGATIIVTDRGRPIARVTRVDTATDRLADLIAAGVVTAPISRHRRRPARRISADGPVSDLVDDQRR